MLSFSLILSESPQRGKIASLKIYFPFDEIVTIDFSEAAQLVALLRAFKQEDLIFRLRKFLSSPHRVEEPSGWRQLTNEAVG